MLKGNEYKGEENLYPFYSMCKMDDASRRMFAKAYAATKAKKADTDAKETKHHKNVTL